MNWKGFSIFCIQVSAALIVAGGPETTKAGELLEYTCIHTPPIVAEAGKDLLFEANVPEFKKVRNVILFIRFEGEKKFSAIPFIRVAGDLFRAAVPGDDLHGRYLDYYIGVYDRMGKRANIFAGPGKPHRIRISGSDSGISIGPEGGQGSASESIEPIEEEGGQVWEPITSGDETSADKEEAGQIETGESPAVTPQDELAEVFAVYGAEDIVVSAAKREQRMGEAPAAIFVITEEDLRYSGMSSIVEVLRLAPGSEVYHINPSNVSMGVRGLTTEMNNMVLVLIDGREVNLDLFGNTFWEALPISIDEVQRIEVIRGPGSTLYGANAFSGVVNIITKRPKDRDGVSAVASMRAGSVGTFVAHGSVYGREGSVGYVASVGYDSMNAWWNSHYDAKDVLKGRFGTSFDLMEDMVLSFELGGILASPGAEGRDYDKERQIRAKYNKAAKDGDIDAQKHWNQEYANVVDNPFRGGNKIYSVLAENGVDAINGYAMANFRWSGLEARFCWTKIIAKLGFIGLEPIKFDIDVGGSKLDAGTLYLPQDLNGVGNTYDLDIMYTTPEGLIPYNRLTIGANGRIITLTASNVTPADSTEKRVGVFLEDELRFVDWLAVTGGIRLDFNDITPATVDGISPRANVTVIPYKDHYLRAGFSSAFRKPSWLEARMHMKVDYEPGRNLDLKNVESIFTQGIGNSNLDNEKMYSVEAGYMGYLWNRRIRLNLDFFYTWYRDFIEFEYKLDPMDVAGLDSTPDKLESYIQFRNSGNNATAYGLEAGLDFMPLSFLKLFANFSWLRVSRENEVDDQGNPLPDERREENRNPKYTFNLGARAAFEFGLTTSVWMNYVSEYSKDVRNPDALFSVDESSSSSYITQWLGNEVMLNARIGWKLLDNRLEVGVEGWNLLAPLRGYPRQFPGRSESVDVDLSSGVDKRNIGNFGGERMNMRILGFVRYDY